MNKYLLLTIALLFSVQLSMAQDAIFTDRPNTTDAAQLLEPGVFQAELGYARMKDGDYSKTDVPNVNLKYGILPWLEMRIQTNYSRTHLSIDGIDTVDYDVNGLTPITLAPKIKLIEQNFAIPAITLTPLLTPGHIGAEGFQNDHFNYGFRFLFENVLNDKFTWGHGFGADWDDSRETTWAYSSALSMSITDKLGSFAEIYGYFANDYPSQHVFDAGLTYAATSDLQFDIAGGIPLNENAPDYTFTIGVSYRAN